MATHAFALAAVESARCSEGILSSSFANGTPWSFWSAVQLHGQVGKAAEQTFQAIHPSLHHPGCGPISSDLRLTTGISLCVSHLAILPISVESIFICIYLLYNIGDKNFQFNSMMYEVLITIVRWFKVNTEYLSFIFILFMNLWQAYRGKSVFL